MLTILTDLPIIRIETPISLHEGGSFALITSPLKIDSWLSAATENEVAAEIGVSRRCSFCGSTLLKKETPNVHTNFDDRRKHNEFGRAKVCHEVFGMDDRSADGDLASQAGTTWRQADNGTIRQFAAHTSRGKYNPRETWKAAKIDERKPDGYSGEGKSYDRPVGGRVGLITLKVNQSIIETPMPLRRIGVSCFWGKNQKLADLRAYMGKNVQFQQWGSG